MHSNKPLSSEDQVKAIADTAPIMLLMLDKDNNAVYVNASWLYFTGRTIEQETGEQWLKGIHQADLDFCLQTFKKAAFQQSSFKISFRLKNGDHNYHWMVCNGASRLNATGEFDGFVCWCLDIDDVMVANHQENERQALVSSKNEEVLSNELFSANEELLTTNEELASTNKALQLTQVKLANLNDELEEKVRLRTTALEESEHEQQTLNEELVATNEELAATNEELATTNEELLSSQRRLEKLLEELKESEHRTRSLIESAPLPIAVYKGREMKIVLANQSIIDIWGKGNDVFSHTYHSLLPELGNQAIYDQLDEVYTTGKAFHARNQRVDIVVDNVLQPFYFNYSFVPIFDTKGEIYGIMNTGAEVTDIVRAKQLVEQSEKNLHNIILQAPVAMCILMGPKHTVMVANDMMIEFWGKERAAILDKPLFEVLPEAREQGLEQIMADVFHRGETFEAVEMPVSLYRGSQNGVIYQNVVYEPYRDNTGKVIGIIAITTDATEQVLARQKLEQSLDEVQKLQRQKDDFIGIASHELKTPLTSLSALIQVLTVKLRDTTDPFVNGALAKANIQIRKMTNLINGFLNISRLESGKIHIEKQHFRLNQLLHEMAEEIQITTHSHSIHIHDHEPVDVFADKDKVGSVLTNLLSNAVKYSPKGKSISVNYVKKDDYLEVSIHDEGMGITEQDLDKLFDRYYRVESSYTKNISGFGIGLYLSAEIIKQHGGRIWVQSKSGEGSTFYFTLPLN